MQRGDAARHDVTRRELCIGMNGPHEPLAGIVEQQGTGASKRLGQQGKGIGFDCERGRVKLHEFEVGEAQAAARGGRESRAPRGRGIGRAVETGANAAGREHDLRCEHREPRTHPGIRAARRRRDSRK